MNAKIARDKLFEEISNALRQWTELERRIFSQAHYQGQSLEAISRSVQLDVREVRAILHQCDLRLHVSLRDCRESECRQLPIVHAGNGSPAGNEQDLEKAHAFADEVNQNPGTSRVSRSA